MKTYEFRTPYCTFENCRIVKDSYVYNDSLYLGLENDEDGPITDITVCLPSDFFTLEEDEAFVDTNNNPTIEDFIKENELGVSTGEYEYSGFCKYPKYKFNLNKITA